MSVRVRAGGDGPRVAVEDLAQPALAHAAAAEAEAVAPGAELRLLGASALEALVAAPHESDAVAPPLDAGEAQLLLAACEDVARELDALSRQPLSRDLAERVRKAKKMTDLVAKLLAWRDEVEARRRAEARG